VQLAVIAAMETGPQLKEYVTAGPLNVRQASLLRNEYEKLTYCPSLSRLYLPRRLGGLSFKAFPEGSVLVRRHECGSAELQGLYSPFSDQLVELGRANS
jgi:hypothetical protein